MTSSFRALLRLARRALLRDKWRAVLVVVLIGLPVAGITSATLILQTALPTPDERATQQMGRADLKVNPIGPFGRAELEPLLPPGSAIEPVWQDGDRAILSGTRPSVTVWYADIDSLAGGILTLVDGRVPTVGEEIAISRRLADRAGIGIGGSLEFEAGWTATVVGLIENPRNLAQLVALGAPALAEANDRVPPWLVTLPPGASPGEVRDRIDAAIDSQFTDTGQLMFYTWTRDDVGYATQDATTLIVLLGSLALVEAALVASAAFAVGIRRRQRELGILGAAGATPRQLAGAVLAEGLAAGFVAVAAGLMLGLAIARFASVFLDGLTNARTGSLELDPAVFVLAAVVGLVASVAAAAVPAWGAMRLPTHVALSGRRPPATPARRLLFLGIGLIVGSLACVSLPLAVDSEGSLIFFALGAVLGVLGFGAASPWLLERLEALARHLPLAPRVALRDTARARTRNGPIVTAVLASVAATIALAGVLSSMQARNLKYWTPQTAEDTVRIGGPAPADAARDVADALGAIGWGGLQTATKADQRGEWSVILAMPVAVSGPEDDFVSGFGDVFVGDAALLTAFGGERELEAFDAGAVVVLHGPQWSFASQTARIVLTDESQTEVGTIPVRFLPSDDPSLQASGTPRAIMSPATAISLGIDTQGAIYEAIVRLGHRATAADVERARVTALSVDPDSYVTSPLPPEDPNALFRLVVLMAAIVVALSVTAMAVALGEAEARADQRILLALGAPRGLRRRITAARGAVVAILGAVLAIPAGFVPVWAVLTPRDYPIVVPVPEMVGAVVLLPLAAIVGGLLFGRPLPEWAARREGDA